MVWGFKVCLITVRSCNSDENMVHEESYGYSHKRSSRSKVVVEDDKNPSNNNQARVVVVRTVQVPTH